MKITSKIWLASALTMTLIVSGCSSHDDDGHGPVVDRTSVPDSAGSSPAAFLAFLLTLNPNDETSEPLTMSDNFSVPADESNDPLPLV